MQQEIQRDLQKTVLNTDTDICLYSAPRPTAVSSVSYTRGRDLYLHRHKKVNDIYYLYYWTQNHGEVESIRVIPPVMAERFLQQRGLTCRTFRSGDAAAILKQWGYGILEEF